MLHKEHSTASACRVPENWRNHNMATQAPAARLLSIEDVVERTSISRSKVYMEMAAGRLRSVKVGRRRLVSEAAIVDFINALEAGAA
jgi:excisionase family DNA binding protein